MSAARPATRRGPRLLLVGTVVVATVAGLVAGPTYAVRGGSAQDPAGAQTTGPRVAPVHVAAPRRAATSTDSSRAAAPSCGTTVLRKADGTPWVCTFGDDFSGSSLDRTKWQVQETASSGYRNGPECYVDSTRNVAVREGTLRLTARRSDAAQTCTDPVGGDFSTRYTGAMVTTWDRFSQAFGKFRVRARFPSAKQSGLHSALWLWPQEQDTDTYGQWPASGEIDVAEYFTRYPDRAVPYLHYGRRSASERVTNNHCYVERPDLFHTYELTWTRNRITIAFDGRTCLATGWDPQDPNRNPAPFDRAYVVNLTQALGLAGSTNAFQPGRTPVPATTTVDWVRVWK